MIKLLFPTALSPTNMMLTSSRCLVGLSRLWPACAMFPPNIVHLSQQIHAGEQRCWKRRLLLHRGCWSHWRPWDTSSLKEQIAGSVGGLLFDADLHSPSYQEGMTTVTVADQLKSCDSLCSLFLELDGSPSETPKHRPRCLVRPKSSHFVSSKCLSFSPVLFCRGPWWQFVYTSLHSVNASYQKDFSEED